MTLLDTALRYHQAGLTVLPNDPARKYPADLREWQTITPTEQQIRAWYHKPGRAIGLRDVEGLDFDNKGHPSADDLYSEWYALCDALCPGLPERLLLERTPSGGFHVAWRCDVIAGNQKLATRPPTAAELKAQPRITFVTLIETRGKGGQFQVAPSPGYKLLRGDWASLPKITPAERQIALDSARALSQADSRTAQAVQSTGDRPGDKYNADHQDAALDLLRRAGWSEVYARGSVLYLCRPGKDRGVSASWGHVAPGVLYVFSSNASPFEAGRAYSPFAVYTELEHGGDYKRAAGTLRGRDVRTGELIPNTSAPPAKEASPIPELAPRTGTELMAMNFPPTRQYIPGILRSGLAFFIGQPGVGKTPALIQLAIAFATGGLWLGVFRVPKVRVAYIGPEYDAGDVLDIIKASTGGRTPLDDLLIFTIENFTPPNNEDEALRLIDDLIFKFRINVLIIDLLPGFLPPEKFKQNAYRGDYREFLAYHRHVLGHQVLMVGAWHGTKRDANPATMYNGGQGFWGSAGGGRLVMYADEEDQVRLYSQLRGNKAITYTLMESHAAGIHTWALLEDVTPEPAFGSDIHRAIYRAVRDNAPVHGLTPKTIFGLVRPELTTNVSEAYIRKCVAVLAKRGILKAVGDGYVVSQGIAGIAKVQEDRRDRKGAGGSEGSQGSDDNDITISDPSDPSPIPVGDRPFTAYQNGKSSTDPSDPSLLAIPHVFQNVPTFKLTGLRLYLRSNRDSDQERARELCDEYGVDYEAARAAVREMQ